MQQPTDEYVTFRGNLIKLTTNENPTYSRDIRYALSEVTKTIANYTEDQYNNFGWVRANDVLTARQWTDFNIKFAQAKNGTKFVKSANGEFIIPVNDMAGETFGVDNVLIYASGSLENPKISKIVKIKLKIETDTDIINRCKTEEKILEAIKGM